jgi:hypothetical protein
MPQIAAKGKQFFAELRLRPDSRDLFSRPAVGREELI